MSIIITYGHQTSILKFKNGTRSLKSKPLYLDKHLLLDNTSTKENIRNYLIDNGINWATWSISKVNNYPIPTVDYNIYLLPERLMLLTDCHDLPRIMLTWYVIILSGVFGKTTYIGTCNSMQEILVLRLFGGRAVHSVKYKNKYYAFTNLASSSIDTILSESNFSQALNDYMYRIKCTYNILT